MDSHEHKHEGTAAARLTIPRRACDLRHVPLDMSHDKMTLCQDLSAFSPRSEYSTEDLDDCQLQFLSCKIVEANFNASLFAYNPATLQYGHLPRNFTDSLSGLPSVSHLLAISATAGRKPEN